MSKFERFPAPGEAEPVDLEFEDPELVKAFGTADAAPEDLPSEEIVPELDYATERERWAESKAAYREAKTAYESRLAQYYDEYSEKSLAGRAAQKLGEWWNGQPEDLQRLEAEFKASRSTYAQGLESVLSLRADEHESNREFDATNIDTRKAFAERFILQPRQDRLSVEKEHLHDTETVEQAQKLMQILQKNKWGVRIGTVAATGIIVGSGAGIAAGIAAGGVRAARIAGGMVGGYYGAKIGDAWGKEGVTEAEASLSATRTNTIRSFSTADIDGLETALMDAEHTVDTKQRQRKYKMIAGAIIGGGSLANLDNLADAAVGSAAAETLGPVAPAAAETPDLEAALREELMRPRNAMLEDPLLRQMFEDNLAEAAAEHAAAEAATAADVTDTSLAGGIDAEVNRGLETAQAAEVEALAAETMEVLRDTMPVSDYTIEHGDVLWNITKESYAHLLEDLTEAQQNQVLDGVFDRLREDPGLATELGVKSGNIDLIYEDDVLKMNLLQDLMRAEVESVTAAAEVPAGSIAVETNDTLWDITREAYAEQLEGLSTTQQNQVLDGVFDAVRRDPALIEQLGVQSGNIDLIRPGEVMHVPVLAELVEAEVTRVTEGAPAVPEPAPAAPPAPEAGEAAPAEVEATPDAPPAAAEAAVEYPAGGSFQERALAVFGSQEAFTDAKLRLIEQVTGHEPGYLSVNGHQERVFARIMTVELDSLEQQGLHRATTLNEDLARPFMLRVGLSPANDYNFPTLEKWFQFYRTNIQPERLAELGIERQPGMTFNDLVNEVLIATNR
jgi:hypothetical protein